MEFRPMRRQAQQLPPEMCDEILRRGSYGVLSLLGDGGWPYGVPLNYFYEPGRLYFHCARAGHKLDAVRQCGRASFCVTDAAAVLPQEYATAYRSVVVFGQIRILEDPKAAYRAIEKFVEKYCPDQPPEANRQEIAKDWDRLCMLELEIQRLTGKEALCLTRERAQK